MLCSCPGSTGSPVLPPGRSETEPGRSAAPRSRSPRQRSPAPRHPAAARLVGCEAIRRSRSCATCTSPSRYEPSSGSTVRAGKVSPRTGGGPCGTRSTHMAGGSPSRPGAGGPSYPTPGSPGAATSTPASSHRRDAYAIAHDRGQDVVAQAVRSDLGDRPVGERPPVGNSVGLACVVPGPCPPVRSRTPRAHEHDGPGTATCSCGFGAGQWQAHRPGDRSHPVPEAHQTPVAAGTRVGRRWAPSWG